MTAVTRLAFSNAACPELGLDELIGKARDWGYRGIELRMLDGTLDLTAAPSLKRDPELIRGRLRDAGVALAALNTSLSFCQPDRRRLAAARDKVRAHVELAATLGAESVIVCGDVLPRGMSRPRAIEQTSQALRELAEPAASRGVLLMIENIGDLGLSRDLWMVHDAVRMPSLKICWNPLNARILGEPSGVSIPRLGAALGMVRASDARFGDQDGLLEGFAEPGKGHAQVERTLEILKGIAFAGWICVDWPRIWHANLAPADKVLPAAAKFILDIVERKPIELSAYKGDKTLPRFAPRPQRQAAAGA